MRSLSVIVIYKNYNNKKLSGLSFLWCINKTMDKKIKTSHKLKQTSKIFEQQNSQQLKHNMPPIFQVLDIKIKTTICIWVTLLCYVPVPRIKQIWVKSLNSFTKECFAPSLIEIEWVIQKYFFIHCNWIFCFYTYLPFGKSIYPFVWTNLNLFHQRVICARFAWNWPFVGLLKK